MQVFQASTPQPSYCHSTESSSVEPIFYLSFNNSGTISKANEPIKAFIKLAYKVSIGGMRLRLAELQDSDKEVDKKPPNPEGTEEENRETNKNILAP